VVARGLGQYLGYTKRGKTRRLAKRVSGGRKNDKTFTECGFSELRRGGNDQKTRAERKSALLIRKLRLDDIDFEPANPAGCEVVHRRSDGPGYASHDAVQNREKNNGAEAKPKAQRTRAGYSASCQTSQGSRHHGKQCHANPDD